MAADDYERERWRGSVDARLTRHEEDLRKLWGWRDEHEESTTQDALVLARDLAELKTKVAFVAAIGATVGGGVVSFLTSMFK